MGPGEFQRFKDQEILGFTRQAQPTERPDLSRSISDNRAAYILSVRIHTSEHHTHSTTSSV